MLEAFVGFVVAVAGLMMFAAILNALLNALVKWLEEHF